MDFLPGGVLVCVGMLMFMFSVRLDYCGFVFGPERPAQDAKFYVQCKAGLWRFFGAYRILQSPCLGVEAGGV